MPKQCAYTMNTIRSYFTATVAFLVVAIGGRVASSKNIIVPVRKCCQMERHYDPEVRFCSRIFKGKMERNKLQVRVTANVMLDMHYHGQLYCNATEVLVDMPTAEVRGLIEAHPSPIKLPPNYCFDLTPSYKLVAQTCRPRAQYCGRGNYTCVNKCCQPGYIFVGDPNSELMDDRFMLTTDGNLFLLHEGVEWILPYTEFCLEYYTKDGPPEAAGLRAFLCTNAKPPVGFLFWVKTLTAVCLVLTLIVYVTLPYLRNAHGYYVMFYMACQLVNFIFDLIYDLVQDDIDSPLCIPFGYLAFFSTLTTCCWLNVICFDIYWMLRYSNSINRNTSKSVRTIMYHIYCWGFSSIFVSTGYLFQHSQSETLRGLAPDIGKYHCYFAGRSNHGNLIFYWIPTCGMLTANLILFLLTTIHCLRIKSELNKFRQTNSKTEMFLVYKERFVMSIKLFLVFGIPFLFYMLSELFLFKGIKKVIIYAITDLQGIYIFIIFVAKRKVIMDFWKKFRGSMDYSDVTQSTTISRSS
ncbi:G-protein coupled receptor Mth isoform X2 [Acyrthosiphon pisum]|uniref:G-protein coupled receptors family 2 profile 2 domain-containing protein n=1 Tax=Acyrthosiphon pisum TaxID=7029 RepID=A0A8R2BBJ3_ACYPI|nr:G-protein coupled receptor Mth isoform X2 [Acyrthosiphon pisum]|eukprot:XP_008189989.1 PREDICTED: G-protein coupled receptor Mth isoform X2 [Acyrthosiphon pisum]